MEYLATAIEHYYTLLQKILDENKCSFDEKKSLLNLALIFLSPLAKSINSLGQSNFLILIAIIPGQFYRNRLHVITGKLCVK